VKYNNYLAFRPAHLVVAMANVIKEDRMLQSFTFEAFDTLGDESGVELANATVDAARYALLENKDSVAFAESSTNEVVRTSKANHINFGFHSYWIRELD
jgi:hypothetical protein